MATTTTPLPHLTPDRDGDLIREDGHVLFYAGAAGVGLGAEVARRCNGWVELEAALRSVMTAWLTEAGWGDGIAEEHGPVLDAARAALATAPDPAAGVDTVLVPAGGFPIYERVTAEQVEEARLRG